MITRLLREHGARSPTRRPGRTPDEEALRGQFETFFGGAQWVGDGKEVAVVINGEQHHFNLELLVDAHSGAWVGLDVRDQEDSAAVVSAFAAGVQTTGTPPLSALLDNKPSNHTAAVDDALGETMRIRATPFRPQNKAHVEGAFGLFSQALPPINLCTPDAHELGRHVLFLLAWAFAVGLNHRPRRDRQGRSRVDLYQEPVSDEERALAKDRLRQRLHKQEAARRARHARTDPGLRALLDSAFARLRLDDPERHFRDAIALHRPDFIADAIAIFDGKRRAGALPDGADARYLLGIVKNLEHVHEATYITQAIIETRLAARDYFLAPLFARREQLASPSAPVTSILRAYVDALADSKRVIDRHFWTHSIAAVLAEQPAQQQPRLLQAVARRIHASFRMPLRDREAATLLISRCLWPLE
ncbi:MAG: hypothetical protein B7733_07325 [Myxococcales bacterium FL481]|nr:MAG: hypothetical protein B7733_07325 [Myxococcales bacterium FL481]